MDLVARASNGYIAPEAEADDQQGDANMHTEQQPGRGAASAKGNIPPPPARQQQERLTASERVVFTEEGNPSQYLKLIASGEVDDGLLEALEDFVKRQRKRLQAQVAAKMLGDDDAN